MKHKKIKALILSLLCMNAFAQTQNSGMGMSDDSTSLMPSNYVLTKNNAVVNSGSYTQAPYCHPMTATNSCISVAGAYGIPMSNTNGTANFIQACSGALTYQGGCTTPPAPPIPPIPANNVSIGFHSVNAKPVDGTFWGVNLLAGSNGDGSFNSAYTNAINGATPMIIEQFPDNHILIALNGTGVNKNTFKSVVINGQTFTTATSSYMQGTSTFGFWTWYPSSKVIPLGNVTVVFNY